jgi:hypothetical protein
MVGGGIIGYACLGLFLADTVEEKLGYTPTEEDKKRLREALPKIRVVEEWFVWQEMSDEGREIGWIWWGGEGRGKIARRACIGYHPD